MALPFLKAENEETATQAIAFIGICIITVGLTAMNVTGAIAGSQGESIGEWIIRIALAVILSGAELLAAVALVRVMLAANWWRKAAGALIFLGLAWACIQNGKRAVHLIYPEFAESAALLEAKAGIAGEEAGLIAEARSKAIDATPDELRRVREEIAALKAEQTLMTSTSSEKVKEAQRRLIVLNKYDGRVDGIADILTERGMKARGEEIVTELANLKLQEEALVTGTVTAAASVAATATNPAVLQAELTDKAAKAKAATIWLEVMLWVFEIARSFGLWALVTTITAKKKLVAENPVGEPADGKLRRDFTPEEWAEYERAMEKHRNHAEGVKKNVVKKRQGNKVATTREYEQGRIDKVRAWYGDGLDVHKMARKLNLTTNQLRYELEQYVSKGLMDSEEFHVLFGTAPSAKPERPAADDAINGYEAVMRGTAVRLDAEPELPATTLGDFMPEPPPADEPEPEIEAETDDELEIPPEPKGYGVTIYDRANETDADKKDDAA